MLNRLLPGLGNLLRRSRRDADLDDELRAFYEASVEAKLAEGMPRAEAERAARIELGSPTAVKDWVRDVSWATHVESLWRDIRHAARTLVRSPGFTASAVLILALGIGATTAIFSVVDAVILNPLPIAEPDRVVRLMRVEGGREERTFTYPVYQRFRTAADAVLDRVSASGTTAVRVRLASGTHLANAAFVTEEFFDMLGIRPAAGRLFVQEEYRRDAPLVVVVTDAFWRTQMEADPRAVGGTLSMAGATATIVGIAPRGFRGLELDSALDLFLPLESTGLVLPPGNYLAETTVTVDGQGYSPQRWLDVTGRLRAGMTKEDANVLASTLAIDPPQSRSVPPSTFHFEPAAEAALSAGTRRDTRRFAALLTLVVGLLLMLGCANLAGLLLARNEHRSRETAVRLSLGATRGQITRLFLVETAAIAIAGGAAGVLTATWMLHLIGAFVLPGGIEIETLQPGITPKVLLFACAASGLTALAVGLFPSLSASRASLLPGLHTRHGTAASGRLRGALVAAQVAISLVLVVGAALFVRSLQTALATDIGADMSRVAYASVSLWGAGYDQPRLAGLARDLSERLNALPGAQSTSVGHVPLVGFPGSMPAFRIDGVQRQVPQTMIYAAGPDYFETVGIGLSRGRALDGRDHAIGSAPAVVVNEAFAQVAWPGLDPLGRRLFIPARGPEFEVVGIARDGKYRNLREEGRLAIYVPWHLRDIQSSETFVVRGEHVAALVPSILREIRRLDPSLVITKSGTLEDRIAELAMTQRIGASLLSWFSVLAFALAIAGTYGLIAYAVARRTGEIGVRIALGAEPRNVVRLMMRRSLVPVGAGIVVGMAGAFALTQLAAGFLFGIAPHDPMSFAGAALALTLGATLASYVPARRAARVDPVVALRAE